MDFLCFTHWWYSVSIASFQALDLGLIPSQHIVLLSKRYRVDQFHLLQYLILGLINVWPYSFQYYTPEASLQLKTDWGIQAKATCKDRAARHQP